MKRYQGKSALVTGGARGLGRLIALDLAREGANVAVADVRDAELQSTAAELQDLGVEALPMKIDVSTKDACQEMARQVENKFGKVDILVNNVGIVKNADVTDLTDEEIRAMVEVNFLSHVWTTRAVLPGMIERREGFIVCISSGAGLVSTPAMTVYSSTKFALVGFFDGLRHELRLKHSGIKVITVCPGYMDTKMFVGAKIPRFTKLFDPQRTSTALMKAMRKGRELVVIPWNIRGLALLKALYPPRLMEITIEMTGMHQSFYTSKTVD